MRLIGTREGRLCVRFYRRRDGTVVTADCWARLRAARRKGALAFLAMLVIVGVTQFFAMLTGVAGFSRLVTRVREVFEVPVSGIVVQPRPRVDLEDSLTMGYVGLPGRRVAPRLPDFTEDEAREMVRAHLSGQPVVDPRRK